VLDTSKQTGLSCEEPSNKDDFFVLSVEAGTKSDDIAIWTAENSLSGMEFIAGLPGTIGGALWMNARCYEKSVSDMLIDVKILNEDLKIESVPYNPNDYDYKTSPFQKRHVLILCARFRLKKAPKEKIFSDMEFFRNDRKLKHHYDFPSAGSVFKNNHKFGKPSGKIIEELGLRGTQIGGARIADWHGNFIINTGNASAKDIKSLIKLVQDRAKKNLDIELESEIILLDPQ
jgi:UDP-N-acetylmuramate dehydrogenase